MTSLNQLKIHQLRTISSAELTLNPRFNFIFGPNGSGKTSVLEALYLLSCGHSFRSREISPIITHHYDSLTVFARAADNSTIAVQKSCSGPTQIKLNNQFCSSTSQLAYALPCQIIYSDLFQIIDAGPATRRSVLDWGLFHVEPNYLLLWKEYKQVLKQRNALLKQNVPYSQFVPWDKQLNTLGQQLHDLRKNYFIRWEQIFNEVLAELTNQICSIHYFKGWDRKNTGKTLEEILMEHFVSDKQKLYTQHGAHHSDIFIVQDHFKAKQLFSRGQQKMILIALKLAQGRLLDKECLYLFDDLAAELDDEHQVRLLAYLLKNKGQYIISSINKLNSVISEEHCAQAHFFSINDGKITQIDI